MADIFDQLNPQPLQGNKPTPSKGLKFNDSSAAGAQPSAVADDSAAPPPIGPTQKGDIFDQLNPQQDIFDQLNPGDEHYRQLYAQQKAQGVGDVLKGAWTGVKALKDMATGTAGELGTTFGQASDAENPWQSEGARRQRASLLEGAAQTGRNYLNMEQQVPSFAGNLISSGGSIPDALAATVVNKPGGMVRNLLKSAGIINPTPEQEEAEYQAWKQNQLDKEQLAKTPAAPAALQQLWSGGAEPLPQTTAAISMAADPLNYLSLGAAPAAQGLRKIEAGMQVASNAEKAAALAGKAVSTVGKGAEFLGEIPEKAGQAVASKIVGPEAAEGVAKKIAIAQLAVAAGHMGMEPVTAALEGAKRIGQTVTKAGEGVTALAEADRNNPFGRLAAISKDPDAPLWMRYAAGSNVVKAVAPALGAAKDVATGAVHGGAIGAALASENADTPEEFGESVGQMGAIGAAGRALTLPAQNRARVMQKMADAAAELYGQHIAEGVSPETLKKVSDSTMMNAAAAQKMFGDVKIRFLDGENGQFADQATKSQASPHAAGFWDPTARTIYLNADSGRGADTTLLHELNHPLFDSVVANRPELKAQIDSSLQQSGKTLDQAKKDYVEQIVGEQGFTNRDDFDRAVQQYTDRMDKGSAALHNDPNHWIYSELMAEAGMKAMKGKNLVTDIVDPSLTTRAVQAGKGLLEGLGVKFKEGQDGKTILPNFEDTITNPALRKATYENLRAMKDYRPGIDEPVEQGVPVTPESMGQHPGAPVHVMPNGEMGNDFMAQSASGKMAQRPNKDIRKIVRNRRAEVNAAYPLPQTEAPTTQDPKLQWRKTPSGLSERSGTTLGPDFDKLRTFNDDTKAKAKDLESAINNGEARQGWYQQIGEGPDWRGSVSKDVGNVTAQHKQFLPINFHVDKAGNILVRNYSLGAFNDKAQVWAGRHGPLSLDLWDGNVKEFKDDVARYLDNHKNNVSGDTGIGPEKRNAINAFLVGKNVTWEHANPLRASMRGSDAQGLVRSYRLDRLETLAPHDTELSQPDYAKQVKNLSPEAKPTPSQEPIKSLSPEYPKPEEKPAYEQGGGILDRMKEAFGALGLGGEGLMSMSPDTKHPTVMVKGPDGAEHPFWYDGSADWGKFGGVFHQLTAQQDGIPGIPKHSSTTDKTLASKGYTFELPKEETKPAVTPAPAVSQSPDVSREMPDEKELSRYASRIVAATAKNGGAIFDVTAGKSPTRGFSTSLYPDRTQIIPHGAELTPEAVKAYVTANSDLLSQPDHVLGTWHDKDSGSTYMAVSYIAPNENLAKHGAEMFNQKAYWDIKGQKEVATGGSGEPIENMPEPLQRVPQVKESFAKTQELPKGEIRGPVQVALPEGTDKSKGRVRTVEESQHLDLDAIKNAPDTEGYRKKVVEQFRTQPGFRDIDPSDTNKAIDEINRRAQQNLQFLYDRATPENRALWKQWYDFAHDMSHRWGKEYGIHGDVVAAINARLSPQMEWNNNVTLTRRALDTIKKDPSVTEADKEFLHAKILKEDTEENPQSTQSKNLMNKQLEALAGMKVGDKMSELDDLQAGMLMRSHNELYAPRSPLHDHNLKRILGDYLKWSKPFQDLADVVSIYRNPSFENVSDLLGGNHKVRSFYNNHVDPSSPLWTTIDTHATAAANLYPYGGSDKAVVSNFGNPNHKNSGVNGVYPVYQDAYEKVAKANGILPRELQSIVWEQMRKELSPAAKRMVQDAAKKAIESGTGAVGPFETIWAKAEKGEITREEAQKQITAEFEKWNARANHGAAAKKRAAAEIAEDQSPVAAEEIERMRQEFERAKKRGNEPIERRSPPKAEEPNPTPKSYPRKQKLPEEPF